MSSVDATTGARRRRFRRRGRAATSRSAAEWARLRELAADMERRELLDAIATNRHRREVASTELEAASRELDELLACGRASAVATGAEMAEAAGMSRQAAHKRLEAALAA